MKKQLKNYSLEQLPEIAQQILSSCTGRKIFAFLGEMGSGKTTLIAALCRELEVMEHVSSPTFAIVNEYDGIAKIYHFDLFRIKNIEEVLEIGVEDYLSENAYCFIEWPQLIQQLLPPDTVNISIEIQNENERTLTIGTL